MADADVGDEQKMEDPTVNRLRERVCELLGVKEDALFLPSGTPWPTRPPSASIAGWAMK